MDTALQTKKVNYDPSSILSALGFSRKTYFGSGVLAHTGRGMIAIAMLWIAVVYKITDNLLQDGALIVSGVTATCVYIFWIKSSHKFAECNPQLAVTDGQHTVTMTALMAQMAGHQLKVLPDGPWTTPDDLNKPGRKDDHT